MSVANPDQVRAFYDDFLLKRMIGYRLHGNIRVEAASRFFVEHAHENSTIIDVGCGIGIASEALGKKARAGTVLGMDISDKNIWYAGKTVQLPNVQFHAIDIIRDAELVRSLLSGKKVDIFALGDAIEHIADNERARLFDTMSALGSLEVKILITIPSEFYQRYLMAEKREELQIIDNIITPTLLEQEGRRAGFAMTYFRVLDMWQNVQYAHCVLERDAELMRRVRTDVPRVASSRVVKLGRRVVNLGRRVVNKLYLRPARQKMYVTDVFNKTD